MIRTEYLKDGALIRHYSDIGMMIRQLETGDEYGEAVDLAPCPYTYEETETPVNEGNEASAEDYQTALQELGVEFSAD